MWSLLVALACTPEPFVTDTLVTDTAGADTGDEHDPIAWLQDYWTATTEVCGVPDPIVSPYVSDAYASQDCLDAIAADLKIDEESFEEGYGVSVRYYLIGYAFYLWWRDLGSVDDLSNLTDDTDLWAIRQPFIEQVQLAAEALGQDQVRPVLYNMVMSTFLKTTYLADPPSGVGAQFVMGARELQFYASGNPPTGASLLVHEATHGWQDTWHVTCPEGTVVEDKDFSGTVSCDTDWTGAYPFQVAAARLMYDGVLDDAGDARTWRNDADHAMNWAAGFILAE